MAEYKDSFIDLSLALNLLSQESLYGYVFIPRKQARVLLKFSSWLAAFNYVASYTTNYSVDYKNRKIDGNDYFAQYYFSQAIPRDNKSAIKMWSGIISKDPQYSLRDYNNREHLVEEVLPVDFLKFLQENYPHDAKEVIFGYRDNNGYSYHILGKGDFADYFEWSFQRKDNLSLSDSLDDLLFPSTDVLEEVLRKSQIQL